MQRRVKIFLFLVGWCCWQVKCFNFLFSYPPDSDPLMTLIYRLVLSQGNNGLQYYDQQNLWPDKHVERWIFLRIVLLSPDPVMTYRLVLSQKAPLSPSRLIYWRLSQNTFSSLLIGKRFSSRFLQCSLFTILNGKLSDVFHSSFKVTTNSQLNITTRYLCRGGNIIKQAKTMKTEDNTTI